MGNAGLFLMLGCLFTCLGLLSLVGLLVDMIATARLRARGRWAEGQVIERPPDSAPSITVEFRDEHGRAYRQRSRGGSSGFPELGESTRVLYDPVDPRRARLEADMRLWKFLLAIFTIIFGGIGGAMLVTAFGVT